MLQKLRNEGINSMKNTVCKRRGDFCKVKDCDDQILSKIAYCWNILTPEEKHKLITELGRPLAPQLSKRLDELRKKEITPMSSPGPDWGPENASQHQQRGSFGDISQILDSPKPDVSGLEKTSIIPLLDAMLGWKAGKLSKPSHTFVRLFQRMMNEKTNIDLLIDFSKLDIIEKFMGSKLFIGQKMVLNYQMLPEFATLILENIAEDVFPKELPKLEKNESESSDIVRDEGTPLSLSDVLSSDQGTDKHLKAGKLSREVEVLLFTFGLLFENRLLELVFYHEVYYSSSQGKIINIGGSSQQSRLALDPDIVVVDLYKPSNQKLPSKVKSSADCLKYFRVRRAAMRVAPEKVVTTKLDFLMFQAMACLTGYKVHYIIPEEETLMIMCQKEIEEFKVQLNSNKKKPTGKNNYGGGNYHHNYQQGFSGQRHGSFNNQFSGYIGNQGPMFQHYSNYNRGSFGNGNGRDHNRKR